MLFPRPQLLQMPATKKIHSSVIQSVISMVEIWGKSAKQKHFGYVWDMVAVVEDTYGLFVVDVNSDYKRNFSVSLHQGEDARYKHARGRQTMKKKGRQTRGAFLTFCATDGKCNRTTPSFCSASFAKCFVPHQHFQRWRNCVPCLQWGDFV